MSLNTAPGGQLQGPAPSALRVTVPPELQGVAFISVLCQKGNIVYKYTGQQINRATE